MSHNRSPNRPQHAAGTSAASVADIGAEIARLISIGKCKDAVERAKENHKRVKTPESEKLLVDAYVSRIKQFQEKGQVENARDLIRLVKSSYPANAGRLDMLETTTAATGGLTDELVAPLASPDITAGQREAIETAIRQRLTDIQGLSTAKTLPDSHPLRIAATAVWRAFEAATAGPVNDDAIALPEVSRRSPLAGWRMLVRAIAGFHRGDDENARRALEAIPADAAVHRLVPVLLGMIKGDPAGRGAVGALHGRIVSGDKPLRDALEMIETSFRRQDLDGLIHGTGNALRAAESVRPELAETLRQRLAVRCIAMDVPMAEVNRLVGAARKDATFWRLLAIAYRQASATMFAALAWERFLRHAISEKMFAEGSLEAGLVYIQMADVIAMEAPKALGYFIQKLTGHDFYATFYKNQPSDIAALSPKDRARSYQFVLDPDAVFSEAARILKDTDTFAKWSIWADYHELPVKHREDILLNWHATLPRDLDPILQLSHFAEQRNALQIATKRLAEAEAIDPFNPKVRKARVRLILATLWRHTKDRKPHLVEKDIAELEAIEAFHEGDRVAFLWAAKAVWQSLRNDAEAIAKAVNEVIGKMGELAASVLLNSVAYASHLDKSENYLLLPSIADPEPLAAAMAAARLSRLGYDLGLVIPRPMLWDDRIIKLLKQTPCPLSPDDILWIGRRALIDDAISLAYAASAAGLHGASGAMAARFLLMRAESVKQWSRGRANQSYRAALDLARQVHDDELMREITSAMADERGFGRADNNGKPLEPAMLADILAAERKATAYPQTTAGADKHVVLIENTSSFGGFNPFGPGAFDDDEDYFDGDYDDEEDNGPAFGPGLPDNLDPELAAEMFELLKSLGRKRKK